MSEEQKSQPQNMWELFLENVKIEDRKYHMKTYPQCFVGSEAVDVMMKIYSLKDKNEAVLIGRSFMDLGLFYHVAFEHTFKDAFLFYRINENPEQLLPEGLTREKFFEKKEVEESDINWNQMEELQVSPQDYYNKNLIKHVHPLNWKNPTPKEEEIYNMVVIGGGTGGLVTAAASAGLGYEKQKLIKSAKVALIEEHLLGGDCLNVGCVPSKALIRAAHAVYAVKEAKEFGIEISDYKVDFGKIMERMRKLRSEISHHDSAQRFKELGVDVFLGKGKFVAKDIIQVGDRVLKFKRACLATGGRAQIPSIDGLKESGYLTNATLFNLTTLPKRFVVIGSGPIGCEMAQAFCRFRSKVTILFRSKHLMPKEDPEAAKIIEKQFTKEGIEMLGEIQYKKVVLNKETGEKIITVSKGKEEIELICDEILVSTGRTPNIEGIGLEIANIETCSTGIVVNDYLQTTNSSVYAVGDCCFKYQFTHAADFNARIVIRNSLFFGRAKQSELLVPWATYTHPEVAHVGFTEDELKLAGIKFKTFQLSMDSIDRAILESETEGFAKVHVKEGTDKILGATIVSRNAGDLISQITTMIQVGIGLSTIATIIFPYPTQAEVIRKLGDAFNKTKLTPTAKKALETLLAFRKTVF